MLKTFAAILICLAILLLPGPALLAASGPAPGTVSSVTTPSGVALTDVEGFVDGYMARWIGRSTPGAAICLVKDGRIVFSKGYGQDSVESGRPVDSRQTVFEYGSVSKLFVYTTIMRLVEQGRIDLQADVRQYLPDNFLRTLRFDQPVTLFQIMNHTAGFEDNLFDLILTRPNKQATLLETLQSAQPMQVYEPGTVAAYSNFAVALAAHIAERMLQQPFHAYLAKTVFQPLQMTQTSAHPLLSDKPGLAQARAAGHYALPGGQFRPGDWSYVPMYPIGGVNGTAEDLARFATALLPEPGQPSPLFAKRETLDTFFTQTHAMGPGIGGFAHGFIEWDGERRTIGHGGNTACFSTQINLVPEDRFAVIILTNTAGEMDITAGLTQALIGRPSQAGANLPAPPKAAPSQAASNQAASSRPAPGLSSLPPASDVAGLYVDARRMHNGFLAFHRYLSLMQVKALGPDQISVSMGGQSAIMRQTAPYLFERVEASGPIFQYYVGKVFFDVKDGAVRRMSGDFLPLPPGRTLPWLIASLAAVAASVLFLAAALLVGSVRRLARAFRRKGSATSEALASQSRHAQRLAAWLLVFGGALLLNNAVIILRMLMDNYRSFAEFRFQVILNYPLGAAAAVLIVLTAVHGLRQQRPLRWRLFNGMAIVLMASLMATLVHWHFFTLLY